MFSNFHSLPFVHLYPYLLHCAVFYVPQVFPELRDTPTAGPMSVQFFPAAGCPLVPVSFALCSVYKFSQDFEIHPCFVGCQRLCLSPVWNMRLIRPSFCLHFYFGLVPTFLEFWKTSPCAYGHLCCEWKTILSQGPKALGFKNAHTQRSVFPSVRMGPTN